MCHEQQMKFFGKVSVSIGKYIQIIYCNPFQEMAVQNNCYKMVDKFFHCLYWQPWHSIYENPCHVFIGSLGIAYMKTHVIGSSIWH